MPKLYVHLLHALLKPRTCQGDWYWLAILISLDVFWTLVGVWATNSKLALYPEYEWMGALHPIVTLKIYLIIF